MISRSMALLVRTLGDYPVVLSSLVEVSSELIVLARLQLVEQLLHVPLHLGQFLDERGHGSLSCNITIEALAVILTCSTHSAYDSV